jgi:hypothetical protein
MQVRASSVQGMCMTQLHDKMAASNLNWSGAWPNNAAILPGEPRMYIHPPALQALEPNPLVPEDS